MSHPSFYAHSTTEQEKRKFGTCSVNALIFFQREQDLLESVLTLLPVIPQGKYMSSNKLCGFMCIESGESH